MARLLRLGKIAEEGWVGARGVGQTALDYPISSIWSLNGYAVSHVCRGQGKGIHDKERHREGGRVGRGRGEGRGLL